MHLNRTTVTYILLALALFAGSARAAEGPIVAVFDVEDCGAGISENVLGNLTDYLSAMLIEGGYQVIPRAQIRERLEATKKGSYKKCFDQSCQIELGRELAAQKSLATKVLKIGSQCRVTGTLYDLKRAAAERAATAASACGENDLLKAVEEIAHKLTSGNVTPERTTKVESAEEGSLADLKPWPEPEAKSEPQPVTEAGPDREYDWAIALKVGLLFPGFGGGGINLDRVGDLHTTTGSVSTLQVDYRPLRWLSLGLFGLFIHTEAEPLIRDNRDTNLNFTAVGARVYLRFFPAADMELRPGVSLGFGSFMGETKLVGDVDTVDLNASKGMATGLSLEYAWYFSDSFALLADLGFWSQALGSAGNADQPRDLNFKPLLYLAAGIEWGL